MNYDDDAEVTSQSVKFDRVRDTDLAQHASHPKNNPNVEQKGGTGGKRRRSGKTGREWTDENLISY